MNVREAKILAFEEKGLAHGLRKSIGKAVPEVVAGRMESTA